MFCEHNFTIWGSKCQCGNECSILQNIHHPWELDDFQVKLCCDICKNIVTIDSYKAKAFYDLKVLDYFKTVYGNVIDLGCGGGFLSRNLIGNAKIKRIYGIDIDKYCEKELKDLLNNKKFEFFNGNLEKFYKKLDSVDFLISRDTFMFIKDTDEYFKIIDKLVNVGVFHMGWYIEGNKKMQNHIYPDDVLKEYLNRGWNANIEYLNWYKSGYFIKAYRENK